MGIQYFKYDKLESIASTSNGMFSMDSSIISGIYKTKDNKIEIVDFENSNTLVQINSNIVNRSYYEIENVSLSKVKYVLLDLDGTSINSEKFWVEMIRKTIASVIDGFKFEESDLAHIIGNTVLEHLSYCKDKYYIRQDLSMLKKCYYQVVNEELELLKKEDSDVDYFEPRDGLVDFLKVLKKRGIKIALVTSGNDEKVFPVIDYVFRRTEIGNPFAFFDCIITGGNQLEKGKLGSIGELYSKPYPCLYSECVFAGLNITKKQLGNVIAIEDSAAGIYSIVTSGIIPIGMEGGNIRMSGADALCYDFVYSFDEILEKYIGDSDE